MVFNIRRYLLALTRHLHWLFLALVPLAIFLLVTGVKPDRFTIIRSLKVDPVSPVAVTTSPVDTVTLRSLVAVPKQFFTDRLALAGWRRFAETDPDLSRYDFRDRRVMAAAIESLALKFVDGGRLELSSYGPDPVLGEKLVNFYMNRLLSRLRAGFYRKPAAELAGGKFKTPDQLQLDKTDIQRISHRSWWRPERAGTAALVTIIPLLLILLLIGIKEFLDPAFKSGRQAARYLELPILGFVPSLDPIVKNLQRYETRKQSEKA